jgi:reactive intermediate/imine deaminase
MVLACLLLAGCALAAAQNKTEDDEDQPHKYINVRDHIEGLPFTDAVLADGTLYVAGRIGLDPKTRKVPEKLEDEIRLLMDSIKTAVETAGLSMDDVVNVTVYCPDLALYDRFNAIYKTYFKAGKYPARAFIGSGSLLFGGHFEITAIAVRRPKPAKTAGKKQ